jgi:RNA polymerase sigma-70 factor (ECF subfamily)
MNLPTDTSDPDPASSRGLSPEFAQRLMGCQSALYAFVATLLGRLEGAQDVLQNTNVALCRRSVEYDPARPFLAWAYGFARFEVLAWRKRQERDRLVLDDALLDQVADELQADPGLADLQLAALEGCVDRLPRPHRELIAARYHRGEAVQSIAARLNRPQNAIAANLYRIRKALIDCVQARIEPRVEG